MGRGDINGGVLHLNSIIEVLTQIDRRLLYEPTNVKREL